MRKRGGRNNVVGIVTKPRALCPRNLGWIPGKDNRFISSTECSGRLRTPPSLLFSVGTGGYSPGLKRPWRKADHSPPPPSSAGVKNECSYIPTPSFLRGCIVTVKGKVVRWKEVATVSGAHTFGGFLSAVLNLRARYQRPISYATCVVISRLSCKNDQELWRGCCHGMLMSRMLSTGCRLHRPAIRKITPDYKHYRLLSREKNVSAMKCRGNWLQHAHLSMESCQMQCAKILQGWSTFVNSCRRRKKCQSSIFCWWASFLIAE